MRKKYAKTGTDRIFQLIPENNELIPIYGNFTITYRKGVENKGILNDGRPVVREMGKWVLL
jgi:hypothetical protein